MENMLYYKNIDDIILQTFTDSKYLCFDTETCCHTDKIYDDYFNKKIISPEKGIQTRVYAWALSNTTDDVVIYGNNLEEFIDC